MIRLAPLICQSSAGVRDRCGTNRRRAFVLIFARLHLPLALFLAFCLTGPAQSADLHDFGVVYLHGKGGWPGALNGGILSALKDEGAMVATPSLMKL